MLFRSVITSASVAYGQATVAGTSSAGDTISIYDGNSWIGFATTGSNGQWSFTGGAAPTSTHSFGINGTDLAGIPAYKVARLGMIRTFQLTKALSKMTVLENMRLGAPGQKGERMLTSLFGFLWRPQENAITAKADELLTRFNMYAKREDFAGSLSGGQRKLLEMARALMTDPEMVMLDEPMAGMNVEEKQDMCRFILDVNDEFGTTIVLIEHDMGVVMDISDRVVVLDYGKKIGDGAPDEVRNNEEVIRAYLGTSH